MKRHLPPLNALRVFEVAAKSESFSQTADTLFVTQSAVSKQIRLLEEHLDIILFERNGGAVRLTHEGREYLSIISKGLDIIETGSEKFYRKTEQEILRVNILPSLSTLWMFSKVKDFHQAYPKIVLHIDSDDGVIDWSKNQVDTAIRCINSNKARSQDAFLLEERLVLIASPELIDHTKIQSIQDLKNYPCIALKNRPLLWEEVFQQTPLRPLTATFSCEHFYMVIQAVLEGLGIGLVPDFLCKELIDEGKLINPLGHSIQSDYAYYLMTPPHKKELSKVIHFSQWIKHQLGS